MIPDVLHLLVPIWLLRKTRKESYTARPFYRDYALRRDTFGMLFIVASLLFFCTFFQSY